MSWLALTIAGMAIDVMDVTDSWSHAIGRHEFVGRNGAELEWLGAHPGEFRVRAVFQGPDDLAKYVALMRVLRKGASVEFEHPVHGRIDALVGAITNKMDRRIDTAEVEFSIIEDQLDAEIVYKPHAQDVAIACSQAAIDNGVCPDIWKPVSPAKLPNIDLQDPSWITKLAALGLGNKISSYVRSLAAGLGTIAALRVGLTAPVAAAFNALQFASDMPGQVAFQVAEFLELFASARLSNAPDPVLSCQRLVADLRDLHRVFQGTSLESSVRVLGSLQGARSAALAMAADENNLRAQVASEQSVAFDLRGNRIGASLTTMPATADQVGRLVSATRQLLSDALPYTSAPDPLKEFALALHRQYRDRLVSFETLREITVVQPTPLHLICLQYGLPYAMAERIVRLNGIKNPSFVEGRIRIYVSAA